MADVLPAAALPASVRELLAWWQPRMRRVLGDAYHAALLHGSVAVGDFQPGWSDVDVCVVLDRPATDAQVADLTALQRAADARFLDPAAETWTSGQTIDALCVPLDDLAGALDAFDQLSLASGALRLDGPPVPIPQPSRGALRDRLATFLAEVEHPPADASPIWFAAMLQLLARALAYWQDGALLSKSEALERRIARGGPLAPAFALALEVRRAGSAAAASHQGALREGFGAVAGPACAALRATGL